MAASSAVIPALRPYLRAVNAVVHGLSAEVSVSVPNPLDILPHRDGDHEVVVSPAIHRPLAGQANRGHQQTAARLRIYRPTLIKIEVSLAGMVALWLGLGHRWESSTALAALKLIEVEAHEIGGMMNESTMWTCPRPNWQRVFTFPAHSTRSLSCDK